MKKLSANQLKLLGGLMSAPQNLLEVYNLPGVPRRIVTVEALLRDGLVEAPWGSAPKGNHLRDFIRLTEKGRQAFAAGRYEK